MRRLVAALLLVVVAVTLAACGDDGGSGDEAGTAGGATGDTGTTSTTTVAPPAACGPVETEPLDPASSHHVLPGAPEPAYLTDPPTSGAHSSSRGEGVLAAPLSRPEQVAVLEGGKALLQYDPEQVGDDDRRRLETLADAQVTVAPNPDLPAPIVATAWTTKQTCSRLDVDALRRFAAEHSGADLHQ